MSRYTVSFHEFVSFITGNIKRNISEKRGDSWKLHSEDKSAFVQPNKISNAGWYWTKEGDVTHWRYLDQPYKWGVT